MAARDDAGGGTGSARRRRERRLHSHLRHERMAVVMALAESQHHSAQRPKRAGGEVRAELHGEVPEASLSQGGSWPPCLREPRGPQVAILRHALEHMADICPFVQILDAPVPQKMEQLPDFFKGLDSHVPVQVIKVPKISQDIIPQRSVDLVPQMVEQLLEVPTVLFFLSPAADSFLPEQRSTAPQFSVKRISVQIVEQFVDTPVFRGGS